MPGLKNKTRPTGDGYLQLREQPRAVAELLHRDACAIEQRQMQVRQLCLVLVLQVLAALEFPAPPPTTIVGSGNSSCWLLLLMLLP